jgi:hypothetical protein
MISYMEMTSTMKTDLMKLELMKNLYIKKLAKIEEEINQIKGSKQQ